MNTQANLNTQTIQSKEPNLKDFFAFLVRRRGLTGLIAVSWGFMLGGATLVALTLVITALLGGGERVAVPLSLLLGGYSVYFAAAAMKAIYNRSLPRPLGHLCRLFAEAAFYGMFASLSTAYLAAYSWLNASLLIGSTSRTNSLYNTARISLSLRLRR